MAQRKREFATEWVIYDTSDEERGHAEEHREDAAGDEDTARIERDRQSSAQNA